MRVDPRRMRERMVDEQIVARGCQVERVQPVNLFGLSKLVVIRN